MFFIPADVLVMSAPLLDARSIRPIFYEDNLGRTSRLVSSRVNQPRAPVKLSQPQRSKDCLAQFIMNHSAKSAPPAAWCGAHRLLFRRDTCDLRPAALDKLKSVINLVWLPIFVYRYYLELAPAALSLDDDGEA